jgi:hypothetical protein
VDDHLVSFRDRSEFFEQRQPIEIVTHVERDIERGVNRHRVAEKPKYE